MKTISVSSTFKDMHYERERSAALLSEAGNRINEKLLSRAARYLAVSRNGLRKKDLDALLGEEWTELDFSHFVSYMSDCFLVRDDGRYDFTHKSFRAGFRNRCEDLDGVNREILEYFKTLKEDDPVRMGEIIYHAIAADDKKFFVDYVIKHKSDSHIIGHAVRDTYAQCITDDGQWIIDVLHEAKKYEADGELCRLTNFCNFALSDAFGRSQKELEIRLSILTANTDLSEYLYHKLQSNESKWELSFNYDRAANIYIALGGGYNLKRALELYEKNLTISEQLDAELGTDQSKRNLGACYQAVAITYERLDGSDNLKRALELHEKSLTISEQLDAELGTIQSKKDLSISYFNTAGIYMILGGSDNLKQALELRKKELTINEQLAKELGTAQSKRGLSISYYLVAGIYKTLGGSDNLKRALALYEKSLTTKEQLAAEFGTIQSKEALSYSYDDIARIYEDLGGSDKLAQTLELYHKALAIRESLADTLQTTDAYDDLAVCLLKTARHPSTSISDKKALLSRGLEISKELYEKTNLDKYRSYIDECEKLLSDC